MKKFALIFVHAACATVLVIMACSNPVNSKLKGEWRAKNGKAKLNITESGFMLDDGDAIAEDYFLKQDTIFTSYQGNKPYTAFVIKKLDDHNLQLMGPDSIAMEYSR